MSKFSQVSRLPEFDNDLKKLCKRFKTIEEDLEIFIENELFLYHKLGKDTKGVFQIPGLPVKKGVKIYKAKKFACRSLKGKGVQSGIRVIYTYFEDTDTIELIEIYYKGDKENEDRQRISRHYSK
jgi:mRNA-degrading endonuclease RelE of RelBE toxin-antitoxin system